jgi:hypothetical protein
MADLAVLATVAVPAVDALEEDAEEPHEPGKPPPQRRARVARARVPGALRTELAGRAVELRVAWEGRARAGSYLAFSHASGIELSSASDASCRIAMQLMA